MWPTVLRILIVIDGRINTSGDPSGFGLGYVLETLRDDSFALWIRFQVQVVPRDPVETMPPSSGYLDLPYNEGNDPSFAV